MKKIIWNKVQKTVVWSFVLTCVDWIIYWFLPDHANYNRFLIDHTYDFAGFFVTLFFLQLVSLLPSKSKYTDTISGIYMCVFILGITFVFAYGAMSGLMMTFLSFIIASVLAIVVTCASKVVEKSR